MELTGHHILITGGTTGIGLALAQALLARGNTVLAVDYSPENIKAAQVKSPQLQTHLTDLSSAAQRVALKDWVQTDFKDIDILINNAGIQRWINLLNLKHDWDWYHQELAINFEAQLHLTMLLLPLITQQPKGAIINVSSGLVTNPGAWVPLYTAAKTGVHGFTQALRLQLQDTPTKVFEILPPAVNTDLGGSGAHTYGVDLSEFIAAVLDQLTQDLPEITYGTSWDQLRATKAHNLATTQQTWELFKDNPNFKNA
ncbi:hypothetical protein FC83_GL003289 [Agrilactobacillus composti DSM 18527 = JCM 14202]|uniref:Uncharacterized protein n=1 Tax=Agrilactobacillus composti DSM 18527 = JCM 14202 TaxID=1423734 RepID=X0PF50_9LACO|nr:SDR family NAD(P)-dependent oxidoreductase [Agrilactobacillus composti]KRM33206.1 hypothetical protein FC83_GL003289 [Agrilactobacillus composti DSM 18527 = JCM 14202]GAF40278.1 short-chain dehydrodenase [Agrilactobacillus composti DSM 18527 = JCM 14202]